jgi:methionyl-tRNA synthetase
MDFSNIYNMSDASLLLLLAWVLPWKGVALWKSAKNGHKKWFVSIFLLNTLALLEIVYIFYFSKPKKRTCPLNKTQTPNDTIGFFVKLNYASFFDFYFFQVI